MTNIEQTAHLLDFEQDVPRCRLVGCKVSLPLCTLDPRAGCSWGAQGTRIRSILTDPGILICVDEHLRHKHLDIQIHRSNTDRCDTYMSLIFALRKSRETASVLPSRDRGEMCHCDAHLCAARLARVSHAEPSESTPKYVANAGLFFATCSCTLGEPTSDKISPSSWYREL